MTVPETGKAELWRLQLENMGENNRNLSVYVYAKVVDSRLSSVFSYVIVKSLVIEDKRVSEEAKVEHGVLFIMHLSSTIIIWYGTIYLNIPCPPQDPPRAASRNIRAFLPKELPLRPHSADTDELN